jgi:hypothetical protein
MWNALHALDIERSSAGLAVAERRALHQMVLADPARTMDMLISGPESHGGDNLQTAFTQWLRLNSEDAAKWHAEHSGSLSTEQGSALAASFAHLAATSGEMDTAREWIDSIEDARIRQEAEGDAIRDRGR